MGGGAWWAEVHGVAKGRAGLSDFTFTFHFHALEKEMATHSRVLAWRIPWMGEPGGCHLWGHTECVGSSSKPAWVGTEAEKHFSSGQFELLVEGWLLFDCSEWPMSNLRKQSTVWLLKFFYICLFIEQLDTLLVENKKVHNRWMQNSIYMLSAMNSENVHA